MVKKSMIASEWFWNQLGFAIAVFSVGTSWSISRAKVYQIELAEYKLQVGTVLHEVKKVSDTLEQVSQSAAIAPLEKRKIQAATQKSDRLLEAVEKDIEEQTEKLIKSEPEE
ncbi:MAG: hypothetical protein AAF652_13730 [Cyanobacteria bacterium P01_C01_bin.72]